MKQPISRRSFLKGGLAVAAGVAAAGVPGATAVAKPDEGRQLATMLDISKCVGCEACVDACSEVNFEKYPNPQKPFPKM
jgi:ferredoxin